MKPTQDDLIDYYIERVCIVMEDGTMGKMEADLTARHELYDEIKKWYGYAPDVINGWIEKLRNKAIIKMKKEVLCQY